MCRAIERGLSLNDFNDLTIGMIIDYIITYNNINSRDSDIEKNNENVRMATQADFDKF